MCFSAGASFTASVLLTVVGTETLRKVHKPSQIIFAAIPLFFAFQQFTEGVLWLVLAQTGYAWLRATATYIFLTMAQVIWPLMVPVSVVLIEHKKNRKGALYVLLVAGAVAALYYMYGLIFYPAHAEISRLHIDYKSAFQGAFRTEALACYLAATMIPLFVSSIKRTHILGIIMSLSLIVSALFYRDYATSIWCYFAAVISFVIFYIVRDAHKNFHFSPKKRSPIGSIDRSYD